MKKSDSKEEKWWSFSQLSGDCDASWFMSYELKLNKDVKNGFSCGGSFVHDIMESADKNGVSQEDSGELFLNGWHDSIVVPYPNFAIDLKEHYYKKIYNSWFDKNKNWLRGETISTEEHIKSELPSSEKFQGYIDRVATIEGELYIIDYKISNPKGFKIKEKERQLYLYGFFYHKIHGKYPDKLMFEFFQDSGSPVVIDFDIDRMNEVVSWAEDRIKTLKGKLLATKIGAKGLFLPDYKALLDKKGKTGMMCNELCNHRRDCMFKCGDTLKRFNPQKNQEFNLNVEK